MRVLLAHADDVALDLAPEVDIAIFTATYDIVQIVRERCPQMELLILVAFDFHYAPASHDVHEAHPAIVGRDHSYVLIEEVDAGDFSTPRKLAVVILDVDRSLKLQLFHGRPLVVGSLLLPKKRRVASSHGKVRWITS